MVRVDSLMFIQLELAIADECRGDRNVLRELGMFFFGSWELAG